MILQANLTLGYNAAMPLPADWDNFVQAHPHAHLLQTSRWAELKRAYGWRAQAAQVGAAGALVLLRPLPLGFSLGYVPRGPLADWNNPAGLEALLRELDQIARARRAVCLKLEPDLPDTPAAARQLAGLGLRPSPHTVQPSRTLVVDLSGSETEVLARMKPKTRYNIGLAPRKGVTARPAAGPADLEAFAALLAETGARDRFAVHAPDYYRRAYQLFQPAGQCELFLAEWQGQALAGVMAFALGRSAWYFYGASSTRERNRMAPYLAQWEAMRWARARGALTYDLWGVPDEDEPVLEAEFEQRHDGLWGVYRFKRGFGGRLARTVGAWDRVYQPALYQAYLAYLRLRGHGLA
jgi:lipid II:glycine glycyltransferase (peptidoglycan interpeptide bridge formation enzyme)